MIILAYGLQISSLKNMSLIFFLTLKITKNSSRGKAQTKARSSDREVHTRLNRQ